MIAEGSAKRGFDNVLRELTYTLLNRLVGLKAMEMRKLLFLHRLLRTPKRLQSKRRLSAPSPDRLAPAT